MKPKFIKLVMGIFLAAMAGVGCQHRYYEGHEHRRGRGYYLHNKHYHRDYDDRRGDRDD